MERRRVYLVGGDTTTFVGKGHPSWKKGHRGLKEYLSEAMNGAFERTGINPEAIDRVYVGNFVGELFNSQGHLGAAVAAASPALLYKPSIRLEAACASGGLACSEAVRSILAGSDCALAVGVEVETGVNGRTGNAYLARAADFERQSSLDPALFPALFARRTKAYLEKYPDVSMDDLAAVAAKAYANGNKNPSAQMQPVQLSHKAAAASATFLANEQYNEFIRLADCSTFSDGSAAAIFMSEQGLRQSGINMADVVEVLAFDQGVGDLWADPPDLTEMTTAKTVVGRMLSSAGVKPSDIEVVELHDCFTMTELLLYEAVGLALPGQAAELLRSGATQLDGKVPVNTGGGLLATGHPVGATGVRQVLEIYRQMKGQCGGYQMAKRPNLGIAVNMGGDDKTIATMLLGNTTQSKL